MKCIISFKELYGKELEKYEVEGKQSGDVLQAMENKLCNEIAPYNTYSLKTAKILTRKRTRRHFILKIMKVIH